MTRESPFSRLIKVDAVPRDGLTQTIEATPVERVAIAKQYGLLDVSNLTAGFDLQRRGREVRVVGSLHAQITQACVVSLEPIRVTVDEPVDVRFGAPKTEKHGSGSGAETLVFDADDAPDPIVDGKIDLGALATEFLVLGLDPYPRKPGAEFAPPASDGARDSPFDALAEIAKKQR